MMVFPLRVSHDAPLTEMYEPCVGVYLRSYDQESPTTTCVLPGVDVISGTMTLHTAYNVTSDPYATAEGW